MERIADVFVMRTASGARQRVERCRGGAPTAMNCGATAGRVIGAFLALLTGVIILPTSARAILQDVIRADDGTAYEVLRADLAPVRVIMVSAATGGQTDCNGFLPGGGLVVIDGSVAASGQTLVPYATVTRSEVFTPNDIYTLAFDQHVGGRVTLGSSGGVVNVCASAFDCSGQTNPHTTVALSSTTGGVPAACTANSVTASCSPRRFQPVRLRSRGQWQSADLQHVTDGTDQFAVRGGSRRWLYAERGAGDRHRVWEPGGQRRYGVIRAV